MKNIYGKDIKDNTRLTRHYQDREVELAKPNKYYITTDYFCPRRDISYDDCLNKLGQLEDIEEDLGIDLVTLIKALKNGVYWEGRSCFGTTGIFFEEKPILDFKNKLLDNISFKSNQSYVWLKDYGKTWALTKEELL